MNPGVFGRNVTTSRIKPADREANQSVFVATSLSVLVHRTATPFLMLFLFFNRILRHFSSHLIHKKILVIDSKVGPLTSRPLEGLFAR